jgi:putative PEP-CTERM system TPR-repeat lipoprotein
MRKVLIIGLPILALAGAAAGGYVLLHHTDPIAAAKRRMAAGNMRGAELYLRQAIKAQPQSGEAAYLLGKVDLALGNPEAAELELRRALDDKYSRAAVTLPLGKAYLERRHFTEALRDFTEETAAPGSLGDVLTIRAAALLSLGDTKGAQATAARAEQISPASRDTSLTAARIALAAGDFAGTAAHTAKILAEDPSQPDAILINADLAMRQNNAKAALANAQSVLAGNPNRLDARLVEARAYAALEQIEPARASLRLVLRSAPRNTGANFLDAMLAIQQGDYAAADNAMTTISPVIDQLPRGFYFLAITKLGMGQPAQAEEAITKFLARSPDDLSALKLQVFIDLARQHPDRALSVLRTTKLAQHTDAETLDLQGRAMAMAGDAKGAEASLSQAAKLAPKDVQILNRLAAAELSRGETGIAEAELRHSLSLEPNQRLAGEAIVQADLARGDNKAALEDVEILRKRIGDAEEVGVLAAQARIAGLEMDAAEAQLRDVLKRFPESRPAMLNLIRIYGLRGQKDEAVKLLQDMLRRHPDDEAALDVLLPTLFAEKQPERAVAVAEAAHNAAPANVGITAALASAYVRAKQPARAVGLLDRVSAGGNAQLDVLRARVLQADGKADAAEQAFRDAIRQNPGDLRARLDYAGLLVSAKRYDDARTTIKEGLTVNPGNINLLGALVSVDFKEGGIDAALASAKALRAVPQNLPGADALAGDAWLVAGDAKKASAAYLAAFHTAPSGELIIKAASALENSGKASQAQGMLSGWVANHPEDVSAQAFLSSLELQANNLVDAEAHLNAVLTVRPNDTATLNNLAWVKEQKGEHEAARAMAERAYFARPVADIADTLGWILARQGETAKALMLLSQATPQLQGAARASAAYHYGWALNAAGRNAEAKAQLQEAVDSKADFPEREDAKSLLASLH